MDQGKSPPNSTLAEEVRGEENSEKSGSAREVRRKNSIFFKGVDKCIKAVGVGRSVVVGCLIRFISRRNGHGAAAKGTRQGKQLSKGN